MKKKLKKFSLKKLIISGIVLVAAFFLLSSSLLAYVYFSPHQVRNFQIGDKTAQINFTPDGVNIFIPKDETSVYYAHNFYPWQVITGVETKMDDLDFSYQEPIYPGATPAQQATPWPSVILTKYKYDEEAPKGILSVNIIIKGSHSRDCNPNPYSNIGERCLVFGPKKIILNGWKLDDNDNIALNTGVGFSRAIDLRSDNSIQIDNLTPGEYALEYQYLDPPDNIRPGNVTIKSGEVTTVDLDFSEYFSFYP